METRPRDTQNTQKAAMPKMPKGPRRTAHGAAHDVMRDVMHDVMRDAVREAMRGATLQGLPPFLEPGLPSTLEVYSSRGRVSIHTRTRHTDT